MGSASCKNSKASEHNQQPREKEQKDESKKITIGVFGLNNAGKTSAVKAIEGAPTAKVKPTMDSDISTVSTQTSKNGTKAEVEIIDVSGKENYRNWSWSQFYDRIHGLIFVVDASEHERFEESKDTLEDLLRSDKIRNKPVLILANKKDLKTAVTNSNQIKEDLDIERFKPNYKIELCTALPQKGNKADESIQNGFSWLIRTIEGKYSELNARVNNATNSHAPKPMERKGPVSNRGRHNASDSADDSDHGIVHPTKRSEPSTLKKTPANDRSPYNSHKLPTSDFNKTKTKISGHDTYDEDDSDKEKNDRSRSRPNISRPDPNDRYHSRSNRSPTHSDDDDHRHSPVHGARSKADEYDRNRSTNPANLLSTGGMHKKKKLTGATNNYNDSSNKRPDNNEPKSFRAPYEQFNDRAPWSSSTGKTTKDDFDTSKPFTKPLSTNSSTNRYPSPLLHDTKPVTSGLTSKRSNLSDDEEHDRFNDRYQPKSTTLSTIKPSSTFKKPLSGIHGASDEDEDDKKGSSNYRRPPLSTSTAATKKPFKHDDDDDDDDAIFKKKPITRSYGSDDDDNATFKKKPAKKSFGSDDDDDDKNTHRKSYQQPADRSSDPYSSYRGVTSKPPASPLPTSKQWKHDEDDFPSSLTSAYSSKPLDRTRTTSDKYPSTLSKPPVRLNRDHDDDDDVALPSKSTLYNRHADDYKSSRQSPVRGKYEDEDRSSSPLKSTSRPRHDEDDDDDRPSYPSKAPTRPRYDADNRSSSPAKPTTTSRFEYNDDRPASSSKPINRSRIDEEEYGGGGRSRFGAYDLNSSKGGSNNARASSASNDRLRNNTDF